MNLLISSFISFGAYFQLLITWFWFLLEMCYNILKTVLVDGLEILVHKYKTSDIHLCL